MNNKTLLIVALVAAGAVVGYMVWQNKKKNAATGSTPVTNPGSTNPSTGGAGGVSGVVDDLAGAWDSLSHLWGGGSNPPSTSPA